MRIKAIKHTWINFNCSACKEPIQVLLGTWKEVVCSCGYLHKIEEIAEEKKIQEQRSSVS